MIKVAASEGQKVQRIASPKKAESPARSPAI